MWKKDDVRPGEQPTNEPQWAPERAAPAVPTASAAPAAPAGQRAVIGRSITVRGDVTGDEDLVIQGRVEGSVNLEEHSVTVGADGEVNASIVGRVVTIEGRVVGNIRASEQVALRSSAFVQGDIAAPRVALDNGARFRGLVDMGEVDEHVRSGSAAGEPRRTGENGKTAFASPKSPADGAEATTSDAGKASGSALAGTGKGKRPSEAGTEVTV